MSNGATPIKYEISFEKDNASVKVSYDLKVPVGGVALIADFQVSVGATDLSTGFAPGQTRFNGVRYHVLPHPDQDAPVSFAMASNQGWTTSDSSVLRGNKKYDGAEFSG